MLDQAPYNPGPYDDDWEGQPGQGAFFQWGLGLAVPLLLAGVGLHAILTRSALFGAANTSIPLHGTSAVALGAAFVSAGLFLHCHYFWGNIYDQAWFAVLGKIVAASAFIAALATLIVNNGVFGR